MKKKTIQCKSCGKFSVYAKGYCRNCYERSRKYGSPEYKDRVSEKTKRIINELKNGKPVKEIVENECVSRTYVYAIKQRYWTASNADKIRAMSDEKLAEWLGDMLGVYPFGTEQWDKKSWLEYLKKDAE